MTTPTRKYRRTKVDIRVKLFYPADNEKGAVVRTFEMSEGGLSVYVSEALPLEAKVGIEISLSGKKPVRVGAMVRNMRGFRCGLELTDITQAQRAAIANYLATKADVIEI